MYLFCGMADVAAYKHDTGYLDALDGLWDDVVGRNMYITGGIGSSGRNEGFTVDYDLPNLEAYCETCASIGMVLWNHRMNQFSGDGKYVDVLERAIYNGVISGISLKGDRFFYVNPLASEGNHHRKEWYGCACCPSNVCRFIPSMGNYIYGTSDDALWVNLYIGNEATIRMGDSDVSVEMTTGYPWTETTQLKIRNAMDRAVKLRIPGWSKNYQLKVNGKSVKTTTEKGYATIRRHWKAGDCIELTLPMPVEKMSADPRVREDQGKLAVQRGPIVYCAEQADNADVDDIRLSEKTTFQTSFQKDMLGGIVKITGRTAGKPFTLIPYYTWDNREAGKMRVWFPITEGEQIPIQKRQTYLP